MILVASEETGEKLESVFGRFTGLVPGSWEKFPGENPSKGVRRLQTLKRPRTTIFSSGS